jgi:hypothetical protein
MARETSGWGYDRIGALANLGHRVLDQTVGNVKPIQLPARSPNLNAFAERWIRSAKQECFSKLILFGEASLRRAPDEFVEHLSYRTESPG